MITILSLSTFAMEVRAEAALCAITYPSDTVPAPESTDVPVDIRPSVLVQFGCSSPPEYQVALLKGEDVVASMSFPTEGATGSRRFTLDPGGDLDADTAYLLRVTGGEGWSEGVEVGFRTGSGRVSDEGDVTIDDFLAFAERRSVDISGTLQVATDPDPSDLSILEIRTDDGIPIAAQLVGQQENREIGLMWLEQRGEVCVEAARIDGAGVEVAVDTACADTRRPGGPLSCSSGGGASSLILAALGGLLVRRRNPIL